MGGRRDVSSGWLQDVHVYDTEESTTKQVLTADFKFTSNKSNQSVMVKSGKVAALMQNWEKELLMVELKRTRQGYSLEILKNFGRGK